MEQKIIKIEDPQGEAEIHKSVAQRQGNKKAKEEFGVKMVLLSLISNKWRGENVLL